MSQPPGAISEDPANSDAPPPTASAAPTTAGLQKAAMRGSAWTALQAVVGLPLTVLVNIIVARTLGPESYGLVASYMAAFLLIVMVLGGGISDATIQWGAAAHARGDRGQLIDISRRCAGYHMVFEAPLLALAVLFLLRNESLATQLVATVAVAVTVLLGTAVVTLTAMSANASLAKLNLAVGVAMQLAVVTAAVQSQDAGPTWAARLAVLALAPAGALIFAPADIRRACFRPLWPRGWPGGFAGYSVRALVSGLVTVLVFSRSEVLVLNAFGDAAAAGLFALAAGLAVQITAPVDAILGPLVPAAASLLAVGRDRAGEAVLRGLRLSVLATAPLACIAIPGVVVLVPVVYGVDFAASGVPFVVLAIVSCTQSVLNPVTAFVMALRKPMLVLAINGGALLLDLILLVLLVPPLGALGAVIGSSAGQIASLAGSTWVLRRHLGLSARRVTGALAPFGLLVGCVVIASTLGLFMQHEGVSFWVTAPLAVLVACALGAALMRVAGGVVFAADLERLNSGFPRVAGPLSRGLQMLGWVRRGA